METDGTSPGQTLHLSDDTVLISGGGPVGLMVGTVLAHYGVKSIILERNESTTKSFPPRRWLISADDVAGGPRWT